MSTEECRTIEPGVVLGQYKGIVVTARDNEPTEAELNALIAEACKQMAKRETITDRPVKNGDTICLDFEGFLNGDPFQGGSADSYMLVIGSGSFIPGFEEQLIGVMPGSEKDVIVTFPGEYQAPELAGKETVFKCKVQHIVEMVLPEADDAFARAAGFGSLEEFKSAAKEQLKLKKTAVNQDAQYVEAMGKLVESSTLTIPEELIEAECAKLKKDYEQAVAKQGMTLEQYLEATGLTAERFEEELKPRALEQIESRLILQEIASQEGLTASEEELEVRFGEFARDYNMDVVKVKQLLGKQGRAMLERDMAVEKAMEFIMAHIVEQ